MLCELKLLSNDDSGSKDGSASNDGSTMFLIVEKGSSPNDEQEHFNHLHSSIHTVMET
jgi:hypothetical protein